MAFYFLNKLDRLITKQILRKEFKQFGELKFIGKIKEDNRNKGFNSTIAEFNEITNQDELEKYCNKNKIQLIKRKDNNKIELNNKNTNNNSFSDTKIYMNNPSFYFYKDKAYGKDIEEFSLKNNYENLFTIDDTKIFTLTTLYPGLLIGSGYNHPKLKENKDDFQLGFFFDHTTGLPLISGSSIKGVLRSVLENEEFCKEVYEIDISKQIIEKLFETNQVVFYDAFIIDTKNKNKTIFGSDYITSHTAGELKEPNPIKFLKILPDVTFKFQFKFLDKEDEKYLDTFKDIILDFGLGAKTNTGYGKFIG